MNNTFCSKSWTDINIDFESRVLRHCCKSQPQRFPETLNESFISLNDLIKERRSLSLQNVEHNDCSACWNDYKKGNSAFRDWANKWNLNFIDQHRDSLTDDSHIHYIEIKPDRICDMSCLYCSPDSSSKIAQEEGVTYLDKTDNKDYEVFKNWIKNFLSRKDLKSKQIVFIFLGGEPTASDRFYTLIDFIEEQSVVNAHLNIRLEICTNANSKPFLMDKIIQRMDSGKTKWAIGISNESYGKIAELVRHRLDWNRFSNNFVRYIQHPNVELIVLSPTMNSFSLKSFPQYIDWVFEQFKSHSNNKEFTWYGNFISWPDPMDIAYLPKSYMVYIEQAEQALLKHMNNSRWVYKENFLEYIKQMKIRLGQSYKQDYKDDLFKFLMQKEKVKKVDLSELLKELDK
jgi:organic radical activating enzyme